MLSKRFIFQASLILISVGFIYLILKLRTVQLTSGKQNFTSVSSGISYDSTNIWFANMIEDAISKFDIKGNPITSFSSGHGTFQVLPVGSFIWATNYTDNTVSKINANDGSSMVIPVGSAPSGLAFDGSNIWVCNYGSGSCSVIGQGSGTVSTTINVGQGPSCVLFDGSNIFVCCALSSEVYVFDPSNLSLVTTFSVGRIPLRATYMNGGLYILDAGTDTSVIYKVDSTGILEKYTPEISRCNDIANDGKNLIICSLGNIYTYNPSTGVLNGFSMDSEASFVQSVNNLIIAFNQKTNTGTIFAKNGKFISSLTFE